MSHLTVVPDLPHPDEPERESVDPVKEMLNVLVEAQLEGRRLFGGAS